MSFPSDTEKKTFFCECISSVFVAADTVNLEFLWPGPASRGGQFFLIKPRRTGVFLGRPISVAGWKPEKTDVAPGILRFLVIRRGQGSGELVDIRPGEAAELIGPLGNCWAQADVFADIAEDDPVALVGGGIGIAPLLLFAEELGIRPFDFYAGFRSASFGLENFKTQGTCRSLRALRVPGPRSLTITTEDGSEGLKGRITEFFTPAGYSGVFACGPEPMLRAVSDACIAGGVPCFVSLEKHMACGVGACLGCTVKTTDGNRCCCADGPIFNAEEVCFDK